MKAFVIAWRLSCSRSLNSPRSYWSRFCFFQGQFFLYSIPPKFSIFKHDLFPRRFLSRNLKPFQGLSFFILIRIWFDYFSSTNLLIVSIIAQFPSCVFLRSDLFLESPKETKSMLHPFYKYL